MIDDILVWITAGRGAVTLLRFIGVQWVARRILASRMGIVRMSGFEFFPDRQKMDRFRNLSEILRNAHTIKMILVGGSKLIEDQSNVGNVKKVILPHPSSSSLSLYAESVNDSHNDSHDGLSSKIRTTTAYLLKKGISVRWYPHTINHAVIIADPDRESGWMQFESVLPYGSVTLRPCVIVHKPKFERLISSINSSFDQMFDVSEVPSS